MSKRKPPSPIKSFVDLACGSFGAVMLLAVALLHETAPTSDTNQTVWARVGVEVPMGQIVAREFLARHISLSVALGGKTLLKQRFLKPGSGNRDSDSRISQKDDMSRIDASCAEGNLLCQCLVRRVKPAQRLTIKWSWNEGDAREPTDASREARIWPKFVRLRLSGTAISGRVTDQLAENPEVGPSGTDSSAVFQIQVVLDPRKVHVRRIVRLR